MSGSLELTADEGALLQRLLEQLDSESGRTTSLSGMLGAWDAFVTAVEQGYDDSIYEYTNDLSVRDRLARLADTAPPSLREKLERFLAPDDLRFMRATEAAAHPLADGSGELPPWWSRVPKVRAGELADDFETLGHV